MPVHRVNEEATKQLQDAIKRIKEQLAARAGMALAQWSLVEATLTHVFVSTLDRSGKPASRGLTLWEDEHPQRRMAHATLNAIIGFEARLDVVGAVIAESDLRKDLKALWPGISKRLKKGYKSRHEVAHFMFDEIHSGNTIQVLLAPFPTTVTTLQDKRLTPEQIDHKFDRFTEIGEALAWFRNAIEIQRRRQKGPRAPAPALIQRVRLALKTRSPKETG